MNQAIKQLFDISSKPLGPSVRYNGMQGLMRSYLDLIGEKNGFYAFESALLVRPGFANERKVIDSRSWNEESLWKFSYESLKPEAFFFGEDVFGNQFGIKSDSIIRFEAETGEVEIFANSLEDWAGKILQNFNLHTGYPIAKNWQKNNGSLGMSNRLVFKQPLVLGGKIDMDNLICWNDVKAMRARGALAEQIKDVPDGGQIIFKYSD